MAIDDLEPLITEEPDPTHGYPIQLEAVSGEWRFAVQLADPTDPYVEWLDLTQFYLGDRHQRGADQPKGRYAASVTRVDLQIDQVLADTLGVDINILAPWGQDTTSLFGVDVTLDAGLLMRAAVFSVVGGYTDVWYPLWTGRVESWGDDSRARGQIRSHTVNVVDLLADMANVPTIITSNNIPADEYATENLEGAGWLFGFDFFGDTAVDFLQDLTPAPAINRMDAVADPSGLVWRTRRNGVLIMYPPPWDTFNTARWTTNPLDAAYPGGVVFSYAPSTSEVEYAAADDQQPFGVSRSIAGVLNTFAVTYPDTSVYDPSDPVSQGRYGYRPYTASWIVGNDTVVDDLLADRAFMSRQALPLRTQIDMSGFFPALALLDHLDAVTVVHATLEGHTTVTAVGLVRNIVEERTFRFYDGSTFGALSWQSTLQMDIDSTEVLEALLPVEDLALVSTFTPGFGGPSGAEFSWTNPTQPTVTPTHIQVRTVGLSPIWNDIDYPGTGADGVTVNWLAAATAYTFEVRIVRKVNGIITHTSPVRSLNFITPANIIPFPIPGDDPTDTNGEFPQPEDPCDDFEVELQESDDGFTWVTIDSFSGTELEDNGDGTYSLAVDIPNSTFDDDKVYRFRTTCDGVTWTNGTSFDPPDDWTDPCTTPPALANPPFDDADLLVYVPQICAPDIIREAVSGIAGFPGDALLGMGVLADDPNYRTLISIDDPDWSDTAGGIVAFGECPQVIGKTGDKSILARVMVGDDDQSAVLFECAAMRLTATAVGGGGWRAGVTVYKVGSTVNLAGATVLTQGTEYFLAATHDYETGDIKLYVDAVLDNSVGGTDNVETIEALPIWRAGIPPSSWITDCAVFDRVLAASELPGFVPWVPTDVTGLTWWLDASDAGTITASSGAVSSWADKSPSARAAVTQSNASEKPTTGSTTQNGLNVIAFDGGDWLGNSVPFLHGVMMNAGTVAIVFKDTGTNDTALGEGRNTSDNGQWQLGSTAATLARAYMEGNAATTQWDMSTNSTATGIRVTFQSTNTCTNVYLTDDAGGSASDLGNSVPAFSPTRLTVGALRRTTTVAHITGWVAEILVYQSQLAGADLTNMNNYLDTKWGV